MYLGDSTRSIGPNMLALKDRHMLTCTSSTNLQLGVSFDNLPGANKHKCHILFMASFLHINSYILNEKLLANSSVCLFMLLLQMILKKLKKKKKNSKNKNAISRGP